MRWKLVTWITLISTNLSHILVRKREQLFAYSNYAQMEKGSLGRTFHSYIESEKIPFKPNLIRHDLKHILLGYKMNMPDELRIHAFLLGNKSYNPMAITYLLICVLIVPEIIPTLKSDYKRGKKTICLKKIDLQRFATKNLLDCQAIFNISPLKNKPW